MTNGYFFGVPIPEAYKALGAEIQLSVEQAIKESEENGISKSGKDATPWLLNRIYQLTGGRSLESSQYSQFSLEIKSPLNVMQISH
jgi:pseudouridine-5'-phosphate glycosidase/pseudouridine kinase